MQIYVNEQKFDATLNDEKNLKEVYDALQKWVVENKRFILGIKADNKDLNLSSLESISITKVDKLDFYIGDEMDMLLSSVEELDTYINQIGSTLFGQEKIEDKDHQNLVEGLKWVKEILKSVFSILNIDPSVVSVNTFNIDNSKQVMTINQILNKLEKQIIVFEEDHDSEDIENFIETLRNLKYYTIRLSMQLKSLGVDTSELVKILSDFEKKLPEIKDDLVSINTSFQRGHDAKALELLTLISTQLNINISALYALDFKAQQKGLSPVTDFNIDTISFHSVAGELSTLLQELSNALEEGDIVALGDILEYELTEKLEKLKPYISKILESYSKNLENTATFAKN